MNSLRTSSMVTQHSVDAISLCCLTHGSCVEVTGLQSLLTYVLCFLLQHVEATSKGKGALFLPPSPFSQRLVSQGEEG